MSLLLRRVSFQTPAELLAYITEKMQARITQRGEKCRAYLQKAVRDFSNWLFPIQKTLFNGFANRGGIEAAHSFAYVSRCELSESMQHTLPATGNDDDTYCVVKAYMRDTELNQDPLLVLDQSDVSRVGTSVPEAVVPLHPLSTKQVENYLTLAVHLEDEGMHPAAAALRELVHDRSYELKRLRWLEEPRRIPLATAVPTASNPIFPHLPTTTWQLKLRHGAERPRKGH